MGERNDTNGGDSTKPAKEYKRDEKSQTRQQKEQESQQQQQEGDADE